MRKRDRNFTEGEDRTIRADFLAGLPVEATAEALGRSPVSVQNRQYLLRQKGYISGHEARKAAAMRRAQAIGRDVPPIILRADDHLVEATRAQGGFPRAVVTSVGTIWAGPDGRPWRFGNAQNRNIGGADGMVPA